MAKRQSKEPQTQNENSFSDDLLTFSIPIPGTIQCVFSREVINGDDLIAIDIDSETAGKRSKIASFRLPTKDVPDFADALKTFALRSNEPETAHDGEGQPAETSE